ncbi:MAG TPA: carboxylating nicotinate-nucleotide diphosphorylase [Candidatus Polarisedimenticolia bacterium]|nr:carboxylating nicotinate-nucleotide diphosphorylase [Candidatus Polarisedimenticolia bacterium]
MIETEALRRAVRAALEEDIGPGDCTSAWVVEPGSRARARIVARESLTVAGIPVAQEVFRQVDPTVQFRPECADGAVLSRGETCVTVEGGARSILTAERTALNFLQRMSGIATATRHAVELLAGATVQISETRKTAPGLRVLDKYAVRVGGGSNHRQGLYDGVLIKNNHLRLAGGVGPAIDRARRQMAQESKSVPIEVEVSTIAEMEEALAARADAILLDNMIGPVLERAVALGRGRAFLEVSGGVRLQDIPRLAALGIDRISLGALTHSVRAADLALEAEPA